MFVKKLPVIHLLTFLFIVFFIVNINLQGFIFGHEGHAGPHILAASINGESINWGFFFDDIIIDDNGYSKYSLYNHHPKLIFYLYGIIYRLVDDLTIILPLSYTLSYFFNFIGIFFIYKILIHQTSNYKLALFSILGLIGVSNIASFLNLSTFDSLSIISVGLLYLLMIDYDKKSHRINLIGWIVTIIFLFNISWYNHLFFYVFVFIKFFRSLFNRDIVSFFTLKKIVINFSALICTTLIIILIMNDFNSIDKFKLIGDSSAKGFGNKAFIGFNFYESIFQLIQYFSKSLPIILILFFLYTLRKNLKKIHLNKNKVDVIITLFISTLVFFLLDFRWNMIHNFLGIYIATFTVIIITNLISKTNIDLKIILIQFIFSTTIVSYYFWLDYKESSKTEYIMKSLKELDIKPTEKRFIYLEGGSSVSELSDKEIPLNFNKGRLFLIGSLPISKGYVRNPIYGQTIILKKDGTFKLY